MSNEPGLILAALSRLEHGQSQTRDEMSRIWTEVSRIGGEVSRIGGEVTRFGDEVAGLHEEVASLRGETTRLRVDVMARMDWLQDSLAAVQRRDCQLRQHR